MKHCPYCNNNYALTENKCPVCHATDSETKCDNCGAIHATAFCTQCGFGIHEKLRECPKCGNKTEARVCPKCGHDVASKATLKDTAASAAAKVACKVGGHKWLGCKCIRCSKIRDEGHKFQPIGGKCEQRCSVCGKVEALPHQWSGDKCTRCGSVKGFSDKLWVSVRKRLPFLHLEKKENRYIFAGIGLFLVFFLFLGIMGALEDKPDSNSKLHIEENIQSAAQPDSKRSMSSLNPQSKLAEESSSSEESSSKAVELSKEPSQSSSQLSGAPSSLSSEIENSEQASLSTVSAQPSSAESPVLIDPPAQNSESVKVGDGGTGNGTNFNTYSNTEAPKKAVYIGNSNTMKFHYPSCSSVKRMNPDHVVALYSREEAINSGYVPCGICHP